MKPKKNSRANLEHKRFTHFIIGLIVSLSLILISFEWTSPLDLDSDLSAVPDIVPDLEDMIPIPREDPEPEKTLPEVKTVIKVVEEEIVFGELNFDPEVSGNTTIPDWIFKDNKEDFPDDPIPHIALEEKPLFNGKDPIQEFPRYIARNLRYPTIAVENSIAGRVIVQFVIDENGVLTDPVILRSVDPALDAEAIRVLFASPRWTPGKQRGKPVKVIYTFPINFVLQ